MVNVMCFEDILLGRETKGNSQNLTIATTSTLLLSPSPDRIAIIIGTPSTANIRIGTNPFGSFLNGILISTTSQPFMIDLVKYGDLVRRGWFAIATGGAATVTVFTVNLTRSK